MSTTRALVVGIEAYDFAGWDVAGPGAAALATTRWLLTLKNNTALLIDLFLCLRKPLDHEERRSLEAEGVQLHEAAEWAELDTFVRQKLTPGCLAGSRLFVFWSGHGYTSNVSNDRFFFCSDYNQNLPTRAFNASNMLRMLRTHDFRCFDNQLFLADVCGVYDKPISDVREAHQQLATHQLAYFATPEGEYTDSFTAGGVFTKTALEVLQALGNDWHDHDALADGLGHAFKQVGATPFRIAGLRDQYELLESTVGRVSPNEGTPLFQSVHAMLAPLDVVERVFRPHYLRTVADLGSPRLAKAQGLIGALRELSSLQDADLRRVPYGLMQFLMRLTREPGLAVHINRWLDKEAAQQANSRKEMADKLAEEDKQRILMIEVQVDAHGREPASFMPYLCHAQGSFVQGHTYTRQAVSGWDELTTGLQELFVGFTENCSFSNLQIHFLVDPPLFDRPFLDIPIEPGGAPIGTETVVLLRYRQRMFSSDIGLRKKWITYADALRTALLEELKWLPVGTGELPKVEGLCYAKFCLPHPMPGAVSSAGEKQLLRNLLRLGAPCIYLPHAEPGGADWTVVSTGLTGLMQDLPHLDALGDRFRDERIRGSALVTQATLLWDDPLSNPFVSARGANDT